MAHGGARPCPGAAGPALVVASTSEHLHVMEKTKRELRKEEGNGAVLATVRSPAWPWRPWRGGAWSRQCRLPRVRTTQRRHRRDSWDASGALSEMVLGETRRRARMTSAKQQATAVASQRLRRARVERMEQGRSRGERGRDVERRDPTWPERAAQQQCAVDNLCFRSALTDLNISFQCSSSLTDR